MAGKRDVMMCAVLLCDVTAIYRQRYTHRCYMYMKLQQKGFLTLIIHFLSLGEVAEN